MWPKKLVPQKIIACQWRSSLPGRLSPTRVWVSSVGDRARGSLGSRPSHQPTTIGEKLGKRDHYEHDLTHTNITMHCVQENDLSWLWVSSIDRLPLETARATKPSICSAIWKSLTNATAENLGICPGFRGEKKIKRGKGAQLESPSLWKSRQEIPCTSLGA